MKEDEGTFDLAMYYEHECKVKGKDFTAHVTMDGRILTSRAPGEWHAFGVNPGGIAVKTKKQGEVKQAFTREVELVLEDIALENNYEDFTRKAHKLFHTSGKKALHRWQRAMPHIQKMAEHYFGKAQVDIYFKKM